MMEKIENQNKFIFTDSYRTKDIIWEAYAGFVDSYHNYIMLHSLGRSDPITTATMNKYAHYFFDEIFDYLEDFEKQGDSSIENIKIIFDKEYWNLKDYTEIRKFFAKFMKLSGIKNIIKDKDDPSKSVEGNR